MFATPSIRRRLVLLSERMSASAAMIFARLLPDLKPDSRNLNGRTAIVTGANTGIGYSLALQLAEMGALVILACRNEQKAVQAKKSMLESCREANVEIMSLDTASLESVRNFAQQWEHGEIDFLFHNAGILACPPGQDFTADNLERVYQTNFLGPFLLTYLLQSHLRTTARIILTSSFASYTGHLGEHFSLVKTQGKIEHRFHTLSTDPSGRVDPSRYNQTKHMQTLFARRLQQYFACHNGGHRMAFSFHPGLVKTNVFDVPDRPTWRDPFYRTLPMMMSLVGIEQSQGAATGVHLATSDAPQVLENRGRFFHRMKARPNQVDFVSQGELDKLWVRWCADLDIAWP
ncbi:hypothetical protein CKM354_000759100 [Cercospora kikuchii]|uniref:SDR family NAD(P)-dependent oxidoreductase n=1 Tax=Cercospora kikuchii TaxID=84275 RepID=A0A9P3CKF2_9PEZI|nr:uncharacterized protein CKM354_000759100 [Cercospora kikuchii]GIZ44393.1 hypothetical protein CKM354_000759100 [Cercospora kikuchii]